MKKGQGIITDISPNSLIIERFFSEQPRVIRWVSDRRHASDEDTSCIPDCCVEILEDEDDEYTVPYRPMALARWESPVNGDKWGSMRYEHTDRSGRVRRIWISFYYWETFGSIGFITQASFKMSENTSVACLVCYSSHCMLRYRDRLKLGNLSSIGLITHILGRTFMNVPNFYCNKEGRETFELICRDGMFVGFDGDFQSSMPNGIGVVVRMKSFLSWDDLKSNPKMYAEKRALWDTYQEIFTHRIERNPYTTDSYRRSILI